MRPPDEQAASPDVDRLRSDRHDLGQWILAVSVGEGVGFAIAVSLAILGIVVGIDGPGRLVLAIVGGALEGAALASGQYLGMREGRPVAWRWIGATALAAALAWTLGMMPSTVGTDLGEPVALIAFGVGGIVLLASIPVAQWLVLARPHTFRWVPVNAGAWLVAILWTFAPSPFVDERSPIVVVAALYVLAGVLMAVTFALLTAGVAGSLFFPGTAQRLAAVDEANLVLDHAGQVNVFLVAGLLSPGGFVGPDGTPDLAALRSALGGRITGLPPLRKVPRATGRRHCWDKRTPDLEHHIRPVAPVDGLAGLERLCAELMSTPLPRDRPLWEILVVPAASPGRTGVVLRIHHAVADGASAVAIAQQLFDPTEPGPDAAPNSPWAPTVPGTRPSAEPRPRRDPRQLLRRLDYALRRIRKTLTGRELGSTVLLGERSAHRGVVFVDVDLAALRARMRSLGATVNDALLASVASGYRAALPAAGEPVPARLPVSVPLALRRRGTSGNQVGVMLVRLPLDVPAPGDRLRLIAEQTRAEKVRAREQGTLEFMRGPVGARVMDRLAHRQHLVGGFVTNVPGPACSLRLAGAPVVVIWPVAVLAANVRLGVAAVSYAGRLSCSVHFDAANVPGTAFARAMSEELARLTA